MDLIGPQTLYYGIPAAIYQIGGNSFLVHHRSLAKETVEIDGFTASILAACTGLKPLEDHGAACLLAGVSPDPQAIAASLVDLISLGLIRANPDGEFPAATLTLAASPSRWPLSRPTAPRCWTGV